MPAQATQGIPYRINFQGRLTDNNGNILADGYYNMRLRIADDATLSGGHILWTEDRSVVAGPTDLRVHVVNGLFSIQLGDVTALSPSIFNSSSLRYLEIELPSTATNTCNTVGCAAWTEGAFSPRHIIGASPYTFVADTLDGLDSSDFGQITATNTFTAANLFAPTSSSTVALTVKATTAGSTNGLEVFDSGGTRQAYFDANGKLNIAQTLQATSGNAIDIGTSGTAFRTGYFGTSVVSPSFTGTAGVTLSSGGSSDLTLDSASNTIIVAATDTTLKRTAAGTYTVDLVDGGNTTLAVTNSGAGAASLSVDGGLTVSGLTTAGAVIVSGGALSSEANLAVSRGGTGAGTSQAAINALSQLTTNGDLEYNNGTNTTRLARGANGECLTSNTTTIVWGSCGAGSTSLQGAYNTGSTISTSGTDIAFTLNSSDKFTTTTAAGGTGFTTFSLADGSNATPPSQLVLITNSDTNQPVAAGLKVTSSGGGITTALDASGSNITNALAIGGNAISGTNFSVTSGGAVTAVGVNSGSGLIQGTGGLTITGTTGITGAVTHTLSATSGTGTTLAVTDSASAGATTVKGLAINLTGTDNAGGSNALTGLDFGVPAAHTNNTYTGINFGTGLTNDLTYNGATVLINGSGQIAGGQLQSNSVANAALANSSLTVTAGNGLSGGGSVALGASTSLAVSYGSSSNTAVQGNTTLVCPSGTGNLSGTGNTITLGSGGTCNALDTVAAPSFATSVTSPIFKTADSAAADTTGVTLQSGTETGSSHTSGTVTIQSGNAGGGTNSSSGNVSVDSGSKSGSGTTGTVTVGGTNASALTLGRTGITTSLPGSTIQHAAAGTLTMDLLDAGADTTLSVTNSDGSKVAGLDVEGNVNIGSGKVYKVGGTSGSTISTCGAGTYVSSFASTGGIVTGGSCATPAGTYTFNVNADSGGSSAVASGNTVVIQGGNGLTSANSSGTITLAVGAGTGISVAADTVAVDQSFSPTWTGIQTFTPSSTNDVVVNGDNDSNFQIASTFSGTGPTINPVDIQLTDNADNTGTAYALSVTNNDNTTNVGVPKAIAYIKNANGGDTVPAGVLIEQTGAGTLTSGLEIKRTAGAVTNGLTLTGSFGSKLINSSNFNVDNSGNVTGGTFNTATISGGTLTSSAVNSLAVSGTAIQGTGSLTIDGTSSGTVSIGATSTGDVLLAGGSGGGTGCTITNSNGNVACTGNVDAGSGKVFSINGTQITSAALSNDSSLAKLNASQTFTNNNIFAPSTNSTTAFQVQNAVGSPILLVDTTSTDSGGATVNYLSYPGFESGSFSNASAGWNVQQNGGSTTTLSQNTNKRHTFNGLYSAQITCTGTCTNAGLTTSSFVSAPPGAPTNYIVSFYAKVSTGTMAGNLFTVTTAGGAKTCSPAASPSINAGSMVRLTCTLSAVSGAITSFTIAQNDTTARTIYIDAVQLQNDSFAGGTITTPTAYQIGGIMIRGIIENPVTILPNSDSTSVFQVQNTTGANLLAVDSANTQVNIGYTGSASTANASTINLATSSSSTSAQTVNIGSSANASNAVAIEAGNTGQIAIGNGATTHTIAIGTGAAVQGITIGSTNSTSATSIQGGASGSINVGSVGSSVLASTTHVADTSDGTAVQAVTIGSSANASNALTLEAGNTGKISIGTAAVTHTINIGAVGSTAASSTVNIANSSSNQQTISIGNQVASTATTISAGSGNMVLQATSGSITLQTTTSGAINIKPAAVDGTNILLGTSDTVGNQLVLDTKSGSGDPATGVNGGMYYNSNSGVFRCYENSAWENCVTGSEFGSGTDGNLTYDGSTTILGMAPVANVYTLTRDIYAGSITVNTGVTIVTAGWRIFATGTLTTNGTGSINNNGGAGGNASAGAVGSAGAAAAGGFYMGGTAAGAGGSAGVGAAGTNQAGTNTSFGSAGGVGGTNTSAGGAAGTISAPLASAGGTSAVRVYTTAVYGALHAGNTAAPTLTGFSGGTGGGGGGSSSTGNRGGGGGGGGGVVFIAARAISNTGTISANGGAGGNGNASGGVGGGGGGGLVLIFTKSYSGTAATATGGLKGTVGSTGSATDGTAGIVINESI